MRLRLLVVDDNNASRDLLANVLALKGHEVTTAVNGLQALEALRKAPCDCVLLDLLMPVMDGWEFLRAAREDPLLAGVAVIVTTASVVVDAACREALKALGVRGVLTKPFEPAEVAAELARLAPAGGAA